MSTLRVSSMIEQLEDVADMIDAIEADYDDSKRVLALVCNARLEVDDILSELRDNWL